MIKTHKIKDVIEVNLIRDQDIVEELTAIIKKHNIKEAFYNGIGAAKGVEIGFLISPTPKPKYKNIKCDGHYEITSFLGNVKNGIPHTHIMLANNIANGIGGHFLMGKVAYLFQLYINVLEYN